MAHVQLFLFFNQQVVVDPAPEQVQWRCGELLPVSHDGDNSALHDPAASVRRHGRKCVQQCAPPKT